MKKELSVLDWLEYHEERTPKKIAVRDMDKGLTYSELANRARCIASAIDIPKRNAVVLFIGKSVECFSAMLGVLYAGCYYSVIDTEMPTKRIHHICGALSARVVITDEKNKNEAERVFSDLGLAIICIERINCGIRNDYLKIRRREMCDADPMYCNFTSGSTGDPKGVLISHRSVVDFIPIFCETLKLTSQDVFANQAPFDFDVSVKDMYSSLYLGAEVAIIPRDYFVNPMELMDYLCESGSTILIWAVSAMVFVSGMKGFQYKIPRSVCKVIFSGEVLPHKHLMIWKKHLPHAEFINVYGPTEITCNCTYHILREYDFEQESIPIGRVFANERVFLLDKDDQEIVVENTSGEICVAGTCLAIGYIGDDDNKSFIANPLNHVFKETVYRTGDMAHYDKNGLLYFDGRKDSQIKHMGHRIELAEIEKKCDSINGVNRSGCVYDQKKRRILLFYEGDVNMEKVSDELREMLPHYMKPGIIRQVEKMPVSNHGKLNRKQLEMLA